ncbi:hypothetical protein O181_061928 [Austropuccinia psidii MF-1]|uniref:Integrase catalytic domain-containing protein n=1 Tax=Austropuccinia psidii MF-1 TaxID=1389203 RepID=A0A9Q3EIW8_9BASI|nr:hypothetical protein [Austropuccinia psidii MF-1]
MKYCKDQSLSSKLDEVWRKAYCEGRFHLLNGILYHRTKYTFFMTSTDRILIKTIVNEWHYIFSSGHLSEDRTLERVKTCSWWQNWREDVSDYCQTCDRCQKANRAKEKRFGMMIQIQEPKYLWKIVHMDWVTALPPRGGRSFDACLVLVDKYIKALIFLPCHRDYTAVDMAIIIWNRVISHTGLFQNIISDRDPEFTSSLWKSLHNGFGTNLSF